MPELIADVDPNGFVDGAPIIDGVAADSMPDSDLVCLTCGIPLEYAGRGRKPKYCPEHRGSSSSTGDSSRRKTPSESIAILRIKTETTALIRAFGGLIAMWEPFDGAVLGINADRGGQTIGNVSQRNPKFRASVEKLLAASSYPELIMFALALAQPMAIHHGIIKLAPEAQRLMESAIMDQYAAMVRDGGMGF